MPQTIQRQSAKEGFSKAKKETQHNCQGYTALLFCKEGDFINPIRAKPQRRTLHTLKELFRKRGYVNESN